MIFNKEIIDLVKEYRILSRANSMLCDDEEVAKMLKSLHGVDRWNFVDRCNAIARELIPLITPFHGTPVIVCNKRGDSIKGIIEHPSKRLYNDYNGNVKEIDNPVCFRNYSDKSEGIALWVNTGDRRTSHLYNSEDIELAMN
jgi:hypothetical protein